MKYRKKPVIVEAFQLTQEYLNEHYGTENDQLISGRRLSCSGESATIETLEGVMRGNLNDWIITGVNGEIYPCKPDIFEQTYEPAE